jgi:hypothetical protein
MTMIAWNSVGRLTVVAATCGHVKHCDHVVRYRLRRYSLSSICTCVIRKIRFVYAHDSAIRVTGILTMGLRVVKTGIYIISNVPLN